MHIMKTWSCRLLIALLLIGNAAGCSGAKDGKDKGDARGQTRAKLGTQDREEAASGALKSADDNNLKQQPVKVVERKIIYTATLNLLVDDFTKAEEEFLRLVKVADGRVETSDIAARTGTARS